MQLEKDVGFQATYKGGKSWILSVQAVRASQPDNVILLHLLQI